MAAALQERILFFETFDGTMQAGWGWVGDTDGGWRLENGQLHILTQPGGIHLDDAGVKNLLVRDVPASEDRLCIDVDLRNRPESLYENAGIMLYLDNDNYVRVNKESFLGRRDPPVILQVVSEIDGQSHDDHYNVSYERDAPVSLRMRIDAEIVTSFYRRGQTDPWIEYGRIERPVASGLRIGVETSYGAAGADRWVAFDNFRIIAGC